MSSMLAEKRLQLWPFIGLQGLRIMLNLQWMSTKLFMAACDFRVMSCPRESGQTLCFLMSFVFTWWSDNCWGPHTLHYLIHACVEFARVCCKNRSLCVRTAQAVGVGFILLKWCKHSNSCFQCVWRQLRQILAWSQTRTHWRHIWTFQWGNVSCK